MRNHFNLILIRDLRVYKYQQTEWLQPLIFFVIICSIFPLSLNPTKEILKIIGSPIIWVGVVLSLMMSTDSVLKNDYEEGNLNQYYLNADSFPLIILAKALAHWLAFGLPILIIVPFIALSFYLPFNTIKILIITLSLSIPILSMIALLGSALTLHLKKGGLLLAILVLPLYFPVIILGTSITHMAMLNIPVNAELAILGALSIIVLLSFPWLIVQTIKMDIRQFA
ncbi:MAG: heme transporter [Francisellaceae bacterium]|nr:heme transporter [Francisellaceae bacterium]